MQFADTYPELNVLANRKASVTFASEFWKSTP